MRHSIVIRTLQGFCLVSLIGGSGCHSPTADISGSSEAEVQKDFQSNASTPVIESEDVHTEENSNSESNESRSPKVSDSRATQNEIKSRTQSNPVPGASSVREVVESTVLKLRLNHYYTSDKQFRQADFTWTFSDSGFSITEGTGAISHDLIVLLLDEYRPVKRLEGAWELKQGQLRLSLLKCDGADVDKEAMLPIYHTAPTVVRIGDPQHVFSTF